MANEIHIVSFSELDTYRQCPLKHMWSYKQRWRKPVDPNGALAKGSLWHNVAESHYKVIKAWHDEKRPGTARDLLAKAKAEARLHLVNPEGDPTDTQELVSWMYDGYTEHYGIDEEWRPIALEYAIQIPLLNAAGRPTRYHIKGKLDAIMKNRETGMLWIWDHKSGANLPSQMDLEIDDQFGVYTWMMRQTGSPVVGSIHNANRTTRNVGDFPEPPKGKKPQTLEQRHGRTYLNRNDQELTSLALDAYNAARNAYPPKSMQLPLYSSPDPRQCGWKCDFKEVHLQTRTGQDPRMVLEEHGFVQDFTRH